MKWCKLWRVLLELLLQSLQRMVLVVTGELSHIMAQWGMEERRKIIYLHRNLDVKAVQNPPATDVHSSFHRNWYTLFSYIQRLLNENIDSILIIPPLRVLILYRIHYIIFTAFTEYIYCVEVGEKEFYQFKSALLGCFKRS